MWQHAITLQYGRAQVLLHDAQLVVRRRCFVNEAIIPPEGGVVGEIRDTGTLSTHTYPHITTVEVLDGGRSTSSHVTAQYRYSTRCAGPGCRDPLWAALGAHPHGNPKIKLAPDTRKYAAFVTPLLSRSLNGDTARHGRHGRYRARGPISSLLAQLPCFFSVLQRSCTVLSARRDGPPRLDAIHVNTDL
jgi:hypothetical protein